METKIDTKDEPSSKEDENILNDTSTMMRLDIDHRLRASEDPVHNNCAYLLDLLTKSEHAKKTRKQKGRKSSGPGRSKPLWGWEVADPENTRRRFDSTCDAEDTTRCSQATISVVCNEKRSCATSKTTGKKWSFEFEKVVEPPGRIWKDYVPEIHDAFFLKTSRLLKGEKNNRAKVQVSNDGFIKTAKGKESPGNLNKHSGYYSYNDVQVHRLVALLFLMPKIKSFYSIYKYYYLWRGIKPEYDNIHEFFKHYVKADHDNGDTENNNVENIKVTNTAGNNKNRDFAPTYPTGHIPFLYRKKDSTEEEFKLWTTGRKAFSKAFPGVDSHNISKCLNGGKLKSTGGYVFKRPPIEPLDPKTFRFDSDGKALFPNGEARTFVEKWKPIPKTFKDIHPRILADAQFTRCGKAVYYISNFGRLKRKVAKTGDFILIKGNTSKRSGYTIYAFRRRSDTKKDAHIKCHRLVFAVWRTKDLLAKLNEDDRYCF